MFGPGSAAQGQGSAYLQCHVVQVGAAVVSEPDHLTPAVKDAADSDAAEAVREGQSGGLEWGSVACQGRGEVGGQLGLCHPCLGHVRLRITTPVTMQRWVLVSYAAYNETGWSCDAAAYCSVPCCAVC